MKKYSWDTIEEKCEKFSKNNLDFFISLNITIGELTELISKFNIKPKRYFKVLSNKCLNVSWYEERVDESDDNKGKYYGVYVFDISKADFKLEKGWELGIGVYPVIDTFWFSSEKKRRKFLKFNNLLN